MHVPAASILFTLLSVIHISCASTIYGLVFGENGRNVIVSINSTTGEFTPIDLHTSDKDPVLQLFRSCFDQVRQTFYYTSDTHLHAVDVLRKQELPGVEYEQPGIICSLNCDGNASQLIIGLGDGNVYNLYSYPVITDKGGGPPVFLANLTTVDGISDSDSAFQVYDPVHRIYYSIGQVNHSLYSPVQIRSFHLDNPSNVSVVHFPCNTMYSIFYLVYDEIQNKLVGIAYNYTSNWSANLYPFVLEDDGTCTVGPNLEVSDDTIASLAYDPTTATFYMGLVPIGSYALYSYDTRTSKSTTIPIEGILWDLEISY